MNHGYHNMVSSLSGSSSSSVSSSSSTSMRSEDNWMCKNYLDSYLDDRFSSIRTYQNPEKRKKRSKDSDADDSLEQILKNNNESPETRRIRLDRAKERVRVRRQNETAEERARRLTIERERARVNYYKNKVAINLFASHLRGRRPRQSKTDNEKTHMLTNDKERSLDDYYKNKLSQAIKPVADDKRSVRFEEFARTTKPQSSSSPLSPKVADVGPVPELIISDECVEAECVKSEGDFEELRMSCEFPFLIRQAREVEKHSYLCSFGGEMVLDEVLGTGPIMAVFKCSKLGCNRILSVCSDRTVGLQILNSTANRKKIHERPLSGPTAQTF